MLPASVRSHSLRHDGRRLRRGHRFVDGNGRLVVHERVDDRGDQLGALVLLRRVTRSTMSFCAARLMASLPFAVPVPVHAERELY